MRRLLCDHCKKPFENRRNTRFCSNSCKQKAYRQRMADEEAASAPWRPLSVLVGCEHTGIVRDAFLRAGHYAMSADLLPSESSAGDHHQGDVLEVLDGDWDIAIFHPPCTYLANAGARHLYEPSRRWQDMIHAAVFFRRLLECDIPRVAVENPVMHGWGQMVIGRQADQWVQPHHFGHAETKKTGLWLRNLPALRATHDMREELAAMTPAQRQRLGNMGERKDRGLLRSRTPLGMADAMAEQWGGVDWTDVDAVTRWLG